MVDMPADWGVTVAREIGASGALDPVADEIAAAARALAAKHNRTGGFEGSIGVEVQTSAEGVADRYVVNDDTEAAHIEYGHKNPDGTWVVGLHIMSEASRMFGGSSKKGRG